MPLVPRRGIPFALTLVVGTAFAFQETDKTHDRWSPSELEALAKRIEGQVEELRGAKFVRPVAVRISSNANLQEFAKRTLDRSLPRERIAADETIAKLLGLIPPDMDYLATTLGMFEDQIGGYYDAPEHAFSLMQDAGKHLAGPILAHELGHALDDQLYGMDAELVARAGNTDAGIAYLAVVEGSATSLGNRWMIRYGDDGARTAVENAPRATLAAVPMRIWEPFVAPYLSGPAFLARTDDTLLGQTKIPDAADVERAFRSPPRSTEQVLHPQKYWDSEHADEPREVTISADALPEGWSVACEDTLGELVLAILCTPPEKRGAPDESNPRAAFDLRFTNEFAEGWGGDRVVLFANRGARYLVLVTCWDTVRDAGEFYGALQLLQSSFEASARAVAGSSKSASGVEIAYGASADEVVLRIHSAVEARDLRELERLLKRRTR